MSMDDEAKGNGGVLITFQHMYTQLQALVLELRDINTTLRGTATTINDHESRIRALERLRYAIPASAGLSLGSLGAVIASWIGG